MCNSPFSAVVQEFFTQPPGQQDGTIFALVTDIRPPPLHRFHRDEPQLAYTNPGGSNGFQQMKQVQISFPAGGMQKTIIFLTGQFPARF